MKRIINYSILLLALIGIGIFSYPLITRQIADAETKKLISEFKQEHPPPEDGSPSLSEKDALYEQMQAYNAEIFADGQRGLSDPFHDAEAALDLGMLDLADGSIGYISIPKMSVEIPIYIGTEQSTLLKGAGLLGSTSLPIGGMNTNTVLAAHRGWGSQKLFRDIELLEPGDLIQVTNAWETLSYRVVETKIILPNEMHNVYIQEGRELLTLTTCHPYTINSHRYLVYAERMEAEELTQSKQRNPALSLFAWPELSESQRTIWLEHWIPYLFLALLVLFCLIILVRKLIRYSHKKQNK